MIAFDWGKHRKEIVHKAMKNLWVWLTSIFWTWDLIRDWVITWPKPAVPITQPKNIHVVLWEFQSHSWDWFSICNGNICQVRYSGIIGPSIFSQQLRLRSPAWWQKPRLLRSPLLGICFDGDPAPANINQFWPPTQKCEGLEIKPIVSWAPPRNGGFIRESAAQTAIQLDEPWA